MDTVKSDGSTAGYYELPDGVSELQDLIAHRNMNAQIGEIFRACYRYGQASHSDQLRDAKKIRFYADAEIARLEGRMISTVRPQTGFINPYDPMRNVHSRVPPRPRRTMSFESPMEEYVAFIKGDN